MEPPHSDGSRIAAHVWCVRRLGGTWAVLAHVLRYFRSTRTRMSLWHSSVAITGSSPRPAPATKTHDTCAHYRGAGLYRPCTQSHTKQRSALSHSSRHAHDSALTGITAARAEPQPAACTGGRERVYDTPARARPRLVCSWHRYRRAAPVLRARPAALPRRGQPREPPPRMQPASVACEEADR